MEIYGKYTIAPADGWTCPFCGGKDYGLIPDAHVCWSIDRNVVSPSEMMLWNLIVRKQMERQTQ